MRPAYEAQEQQMPRHFPPCEGSIEGLDLPQLAWDVLHREGIQTIMEQCVLINGGGLGR